MVHKDLGVGFVWIIPFFHVNSRTMSHEFPFAFIQNWGSPMELLVVAFAVLLLFGAKSLPDALRTLGKWQQKCSRAWREIQNELMEVEKPFDNARKAWEEEIQEFTVSSSERPRVLPPPEETSGQKNQTDRSDPSDPQLKKEEKARAE
jgi:Sec-independent protein translocase protein TatA